jgi:hypothetical protein
MTDGVLSLIYGITLAHLRDRDLAVRAAETAARAIWSNPRAAGAAGSVAERYISLVALQHARRVAQDARPHE